MRLKTFVLPALVGISAILVACDSDDASDRENARRDSSNDSPMSGGSKSAEHDPPADDEAAQGGRDADSEVEARPDAGREDAGAANGSHDAGSKDSGKDEPAPSDTQQHVYATSTVLLSQDGETSYVTLLSDLDALDGKPIDLDTSREYPGWAGIIGSDGKLFVFDGEAPTVHRFGLEDKGGKLNLAEEGSVSFLNFGAQYAGGAFVAPDKAYDFPGEGLIWNPVELTVEGTFELPTVEHKAEGLEWQGVGAGRNFVARGNRAYVATHWANWDEYTMADDSLIVVFDVEHDTVLKTITVPCPYLDVATIAEDGYVYFSNWVYSIGQTLLDGKRKACAVRIAPGNDELDKDWSLTFADVTDGREGAALQYIGNNKATFAAYHHERVDELKSQTNRAELAGMENWRLWLLDLETHKASLVEDIGWSSGGFSSQSIDGRGFVMVPTADYAETHVYEVRPDGAAQPRWTTKGWSGSLLKLR